jgi:hypothetical protein
MSNPRNQYSARSRSNTNTDTSIIIADHSPFPFLFVGCWNKGSTSQDRVQQRMKNYIAAAAIYPKALILGGDNIYPDKVTTTPGHPPRKVYARSKLLDGYRKMESLNVPLYVALGNHNVISSEILETEMKLPWTIPSNYYCIRFAPDPSIQIIVLDTNLYTTTKTANEARKQEDWLETILQETPQRRTIIVQHEPLLALKVKGANITTALPNALNLYRIFATYPPTAVLSADIHNYQDLVLDNPPIHQLIVGTGGADLDQIPNLGAMYADGLQINELYYGNGFLIVNGITDSNLNYKFIPA